MKKLKVAALAFSAIFFMGCSDDDNNGPQTNGDLTARWNPDKILVEIGNDDQTTVYDDHEPGCEKDFIEFNDDLTFTFAEFVTLSGGCQMFVDPAVASWSRNELNLNITGSPSYSGQYTILVLSNSELQIQKTDNTAGSIIKTTIFFKKAANQG